MLSFIKHLFSATKKGQSAPLEGKYYNRTGECNGCGKCCTGIYLVHGKKTIESIPDFERLQAMWDDYKHFKPIDVSDEGVVFQCVHLQEDNTCGIYDKRPLFCRQYPTETSLLLGGKIPVECGYSFKLKKTFSQVLEKNMAKHPGLCAAKNDKPLQQVVQS